MASLSDILSTLQNGVVAINNFGIQLKTTLTRISTRFGNYLLLTGGTLSGDLGITKANPGLVLNKSASGQNNLIYGETTGLVRWIILPGDATAETGVNAGSNLAVYRYDDAGVFIAEAFKITRSTGELSWAGSEWTVFTPTITASVGAFTTVSGTGRYKQYGKVVFFEVIITVTTVGTAATAMVCTFPITASASAGAAVFAGRETALTGSMCQGFLSTSATFLIQKYDATFIGTNGQVILMSGTYEAV